MYILSNLFHFILIARFILSQTKQLSMFVYMHVMSLNKILIDLTKYPD